MQKAAFTMRIKDECMDEYIKMHENIWPEMKAALKEAGRSNYSIWHADNIVFGYYEVEDYEKGKRILQNSDVFIKWNQIVREMLDREDRITGDKILQMDLIFYQE